MFLNLLKMDSVQLKQELHTIQALKFGLDKNMAINVISGLSDASFMNYVPWEFHLKLVIFLPSTVKLQKESMQTFLRSTLSNSEDSSVCAWQLMKKWGLQQVNSFRIVCSKTLKERMKSLKEEKWVWWIQSNALKFLNI